MKKKKKLIQGHYVKRNQITITSIKSNPKSITVSYSNGTRKRFKRGQKYHHAKMFSNEGKTRSNTRFNTRFAKLLSHEWLEDTIAEVTSECYNAIVAAAPIRTGGYRSHIKFLSPVVNKFLKPGAERITSGSIFVSGDVPDADITYADLARFLEFGTGTFEITGAGHHYKNRFGEEYGIHPQPHWIPNYEIYKRVLVERIRAELKKI